MPHHSIRLCGQEIDSPGHVCAFFDSRADEYSTLLPYFRDGLDAGEQIVNVVDEQRMPEHRALLRTGGIDPNDPDISLATSEETYVRDETFDMDRMIGFVRSHLETAKREGRHIRTAGWMNWIHRPGIDTARALEYEARVNLLTPEFDSTFVCVYDLAQIDERLMQELVSTHPYVILRGSIRQSSFYIPPEVYLRAVSGES